MTPRAELLLFLGLPPQAGADEIELVYLERRAGAEKRLRQGDARARFEIERLDGVFKRLDDLGTDAAESEAVPGAVMTAKEEPALMRSAGAAREATGSLMCGIAACLIVLWAFFVYRTDLRGSSADVLGLLQSPLYFAIYLLTLAAEVLSHASLSDASRARFLVKFGLEPSDWLDESEISHARAGRYLGRIAAALAVLLAILLMSSFSHFVWG